MNSSTFLPLVRSHLDRVIERAAARFGPDPCAMWMSSLHVPSGDPAPEADRSDNFRKRAYRSIHAPDGCSLYWDLPLLSVCRAVTGRTGDSRYAAAADAYVRAFLDRCIARTGVPLWGNHYFWDPHAPGVRKFHGDEPPELVDPADEDGELHETRPLRPDWDALWRVDADRTATCIRAIAYGHLFDPEAGGFNRHADRQAGHAFLEAGGILAESLCWLARRAGDAAAADQALRVARFSWSFRGEATDLPPVSPLIERWDRHACTTEVGLWARCLLRCADLTGREEFADIAARAAAAYLRFGWDAAAGRYYGKLSVADGAPVLGAGETPYQPDDYADPWEPLFPRHDYPMALAEACVDLHERTGDARFAEGVRRWTAVVADGMPARDGRGAYAEHYGRCIHFLLRAARTLDDEQVAAQARKLADEACDVLRVGEMFRTHPGEDRCDAVDGAGVLFAALLSVSD